MRTVLVLSLLVVVVVVQAKMVDISREIQTVVKVHNDERMNPQLRAANMREMVWDSRLQSQAEQWAKRCLYERPHFSMGVGANLHYQRDFVYNDAAAYKLVKNSLNAWIGQKDKFVYSTHCGAACLYVQMIHSGSERVGCAMNTCPNLKARWDIEVRGTVFVCLYSKARLQDSFPYIQGTPCSRCVRGDSCIGGYLCSKDGTYAEFKIVEPVVETTRRPEREYQNDMSSSEMRNMLELHNDMRQRNGLKALEWDKYLERFSKYVINCTVDYPGPRHAYTNFYRMRSSEPATKAVTDWMRDADDIPARTEHKCRTPYDREDCNHYTNMMQSRLTGMACATRSCGRYSRQMVCIYDNRSDRNYRLAEIRRVRRPRRKWRW